MELDDFKNTDLLNSSANNFNRLTEAFKTNIKNQKRKSILAITILVTLSLIYISKIFQNSDKLTGTGYALSGAGFILGAFYLYIRYKQLPDSYYSMTMTDFINKAETRLKFMNFMDWIIILPLLIILGAGGGIIFVTRLAAYIEDIKLLVIIWIIFFICLSIFGFYASRKNWSKDHGDLFNDVQNFKNSIRENDQ